MGNSCLRSILRFSEETVIVETTGPFAPGDYIVHTSFSTAGKSSDAYFVKVDRSTMTVTDIPPFTLDTEGLTMRDGKILITSNDPITVSFTSNQSFTAIIIFRDTDKDKRIVGEPIPIVGENFGSFKIYQEK